jgi:hypothetical protein
VIPVNNCPDDAKAWSQSVQYRKGDIVIHNGKRYLASCDNAGVAPGTDPGCGPSKYISPKPKPTAATATAKPNPRP